jgi:CRP/FNR family transcriptional regulator, dissimilatory nitrate respiration regulator
MTARPSPGDMEVLSGLPLLADLRREELDALTADGTVRTYTDDGLLFVAGDPADRFFAVIEGCVRLFALSKDGQETIIEVIGAGSSFAEAAIFATACYPVNADVMAGSRVVSLRASTLVTLLRHDAQLALRMLATLHHWQLRLMAELQQLKGRTPAQRLAWYLLDLVDQAGGETTVRLPYRKGFIAARIGITPESLSRALGRLGQLGVESDGNAFRVADVDALRRFCKG